MKIESILSMESLPNKDPLFSILLSDENTSFAIIELTEVEVRELIKEIEGQLDLYLSVDSKLQASITIRSQVK